MTEEKFEMYKKIVENLEYDTESNKPTNQEIQKLEFSMIHTCAKDPFTQFFISLSEYFDQHIVAYKTDSCNKSYKFRCSVNGCEMRIVFCTKIGYIFLNKEKTILNHTEEIHKTDCHYKHRMSEKTYNDFIDMSKCHGNIGDFIELHPEMHSYPKNLLYKKRTIINKELNDIDYLIEHLEKNPLFASKIIKGDDKTIVECICINKVIAKSNFCDILIVDDTVGIVSLNYPVEIVVVKDPNGKIQLLGFGIIDSKRTDSYTDFFKGFKELIEIERKKSKLTEEVGKIIVCDRSSAQTAGIINVFNNTNIIYCREHIIRNLINHYGNIEIVKKCKRMLYERTIVSENEFLEEFNKLENSNFKTFLSNDFKYFLPSYVDKLYNRGILNSNFAESTFSALKRSCLTTIHPITIIIEKLILLSESWMYRLIDERPENIPLLLKSKIPPNVGKWVLQYLEDEFNQALSVKENDICNCQNVYHLPCRHEFVKEIPNEIKIPKEYLRIDNYLLNICEKERNRCRIESINLETKRMDLKGLVDVLYSEDGTLPFINFLANRIIRYLEYDKNKWNVTKQMGSGTSGKRKFSSNCDKYNYKKKRKEDNKKKEETKPKSIPSNNETIIKYKMPLFFNS